MDFIEVDGKKLPIKLTTKAKADWEKLAKMKWTELFGVADENGNYITLPKTPDIDQSMYLCIVVLQEGHRLENKKFDMELTEFYDFNDKHDIESKIVEIIFPKSEKK